MQTQLRLTERWVVFVGCTTIAAACLVWGLFAGCSDKSADSGDDPDGIPSASAAGLIYWPGDGARAKSTGSGIVIVDSAANAPEGFVPVSGASVTATDIDGEELDEATSSASGEFKLDGLTHGLVSLEIRTTPSAPDPDTVIHLTALAGLTALLGGDTPVDHDSAAHLALDGASCETFVIGTLQPVPPGTKVSDYISGDAIRTTSALEWLFMADNESSSLYPHALEFVFVNAMSGQVTRIEAAGPPAINGGALWGSDLDYLHYDGIDWFTVVDADTLIGSGLTESVEIVKRPDCPDAANRGAGWALPDELLKELESASAADIFMFQICGLRRSDGYSDIIRFNYFASRFAPAANRETVVFPFAPDAATGTAAYDAAWNRLHTKINNRLAQGGKPTLIVFVHGHSANVSPGPQFGGLTAEYLNGTSEIWTSHRLGLHHLRPCKMRLLAHLCYSQDFITAAAERFLELPFNQRADYIGYSSSSSTETSHGFLLESELEGTALAGSFFLTATMPHMVVDANNELTGLTDPNGQYISQLQSISFAGIVQHPQIMTVIGSPLWCTGLGPVVSITSPPILHTSIGIALSCDEELPQIVFFNGDTSTINWSIGDPKGAFRYPTPGGSLDAGETTMVGINYKCTEETSFTAPVTISGSRVNGTRSGSATTFVTVTIDPGSKSSDFVIDVLGPLAGRDINIWHPLPSEAQIDSTKLEMTQSGQPPPAAPWPTCPQTTFSVVYEGLKPDDTLYYGVHLRLENNTLDICGPEETIPCRYTIWYSRRP